MFHSLLQIHDPLILLPNLPLLSFGRLRFLLSHLNELLEICNLLFAHNNLLHERLFPLAIAQISLIELLFDPWEYVRGRPSEGAAWVTHWEWVLSILDKGLLSKIRGGCGVNCC